MREPTAVEEAGASGSGGAPLPVSESTTDCSRSLGAATW